MKFTKDMNGSVSVEIKVQDIKDLLGVVPLSSLKNFFTSNKKDKIGIIIGISTEEDDERNRVDNDLIKEVNNFLNTSNLVGLFNVIKLNSEESKKIDNQNWIKVLEKKGSHLIIYGHVAKRKEETGYSLKLEAGVRHKPIPTIVSNILSSEFASLFPRQRFIPANNDLLGFDVTAKEIALVAQYMVGVALFVSGFLGLSFTILKSLSEKIDSVSNKTISIGGLLKQKTGDRIVNISMAICALLYDSFAIKRDVEFVRDSKKYIDIVNASKSNEKSIKHLESIYYFLIEKDVDKAIMAYHTFDDALRPYNLGFLYFFKGDFKKGQRCYKNAFKREIPDRALIDLEVFITEIMEAYPKKYELLFARALINYKGKKDFKLAKDDFKEFLRRCGSEEKYKELIKLSSEYMARLKK